MVRTDVCQGQVRLAGGERREVPRSEDVPRDLRPSGEGPGATIETVARAMRHKTTKTTKRYYARIRADSAFAEIERGFGRPVKVQPGPTWQATGGERPGRDSNPSTRLDRPGS